MTEFTFGRAQRRDASLLIGVAGGTGSGKTMSALRLARGLAGDKPFALIDTESGRALHYADILQPWDHGDLAPPFRPRRYADAIKAAAMAGYPVIVVDSVSHEHAGDGGLLDWHEEELERMAGNDAKRRETMKMAAWIKPKTSHKREFVNQLLQLRAHVILCFRAEEKIEIAREGGKTVVRPKETDTGLNGWVPIAEKNLAYELTASFLLTADRPGVPKPIKLQEQHRRMVPLDQPLSEQVGVDLGRWAAGDAQPMPEPSSEVAGWTDTLLGLAERLGNRDTTMQAAERHRAGHHEGQHTAWLQRQIQRMQDVLGADDDKDIDLGTPEPEPAADAA